METSPPSYFQRAKDPHHTPAPYAILSFPNFQFDIHLTAEDLCPLTGTTSSFRPGILPDHNNQVYDPHHTEQFQHVYLEAIMAHPSPNPHYPPPLFFCQPVSPPSACLQALTADTAWCDASENLISRRLWLHGPKERALSRSPSSGLSWCTNHLHKQQRTF